jgi:hypothetical protein
MEKLNINTNKYTYTQDNIEVGCINDFFNVNFESFFVRLDNSKYVEVVGIDKDNNSYRVL